MSSKSKIRNLNLKEKYDVIKMKTGNMTVEYIAKKFSCGKTQIYSVLKNKETITEKYLKSRESELMLRKKRTTDYSKIDEPLFEWFTIARSKNFPVSGPILQNQALKLAEAMKLENFKASNGWLRCFRKRYGISFNVCVGEANDVNMDQVAQWKRKLPSITAGYELKNIANCDETALFFRMLPNKTLQMKGEKCSGGKFSKERLTVLLTVFGDGKTYKPLVIGKSLKPHCFKNLDVSKLPVTYHANKKAWMTNVDIKRNRQQEGKKRYCNSIKAARRHSIGGAREEVMNSHTAAINLQSAGHRGFPQVASTTGNTSECPWYMPHQMPPTAPVRQHKRPAPQPGSGVSNVGNSNLTQTTVASTHSCTAQNSTGPPITHPHPPVTTIAAHTVTTQQQQLQNVSMIPPQLPPHTTNMNQNFNPSHLSTHQLSSQVATQQHNTTNTSISPKSPNQQQLSPQSNIHLMQSTAVTTQQSSVNQQQPQSLQLQQASSNNISSATPNLMSTSLNSVLLQNLTSVQSGNNGGGSNCNLGILGGSNNISGTQPPSINVPPIMSTSLHGANFDSSNITWNSSSLSPTLPTQRKCEGKLNGMPWFHGSITREEAENLLQPREDGLFLVRESTNFPGDYTLCVCFQGKVEHYRVKRCNGKLTIDDEEFFEHLGQLVAHYENDADGLCTQLKRCLQFRAASAGKEFEGWIIPEADIQLRDHIGKGEFGNVVLGIYKNEKVAVKMLKDDTAAQKFLQEASVMTTLEHENLVKFIGIVLANHIYLVTEYMSKGSLVDYLRSRGRQHITKKDQINFACDTCSGMEYLENKKVIHRDLAARNVLISESCVAKVADFGLARGESYNLHVVKLPIKWTAPESLKEGKFSNKSDMWSFGILLWEIYSFGRVPYPRIPLDDVVRFVENNYKMEAPEGCPNEIYEMMKQAWDLNPARRPSFHELKPKLLNLKNMHSASELIEQK